MEIFKKTRIYKMKAWNEYFEIEQQEEVQKVNESHKKTKDEQVARVCETLEIQSDEKVENG